MAKNTGINRGSNRFPEAKKITGAAVTIKERANPIPPRRGTAPVWIFRSSILSYQDFLWDIESVNATIIAENTKEDKHKSIIRMLTIYIYSGARLKYSYLLYHILVQKTLSYSTVSHNFHSIAKKTKKSYD
jgi:hypothetical protein